MICFGNFGKIERTNPLLRVLRPLQGIMSHSVCSQSLHIATGARKIKYLLVFAILYFQNCNLFKKYLIQ